MAKYKSPLSDPLHWFGHIIVGLSLMLVISLILWLKHINLYSDIWTPIILFAVIIPTIALIDTFNHKVKLQ